MLKKLDNQELQKISGGSTFGKVVLGILAIGTFFASVLYGYVHPESCK